MNPRYPLHFTSWSLLSCLSALWMFVNGCSSQRPYPEIQPDAFVSPASDESWQTSPKASASLQPGLGMSMSLARVESMVQPPEGEQSLLHLTDFALRNRPETRAAWERSRLAAAQFGVTRGAWYPTLGLDLDIAYERVLLPANGQVFLIDQAVLVPSIELNYLLLDFGRREADDDEARAALWAANLEYDRILQQTIHDVQIAYFNLDAAYAMKEAAQRNLELAVTVVEMVEEQMAVGLATMPMLLLARQDLAQARFDLELTVAGISTAKALLLKGCGLPATVPIEIARIGPEDLPTSLGVNVDRVVDQALTGRPDLAAAIARIRETDAAVSRAKADFMPEVSGFGSYGGLVTRFRGDVYTPSNGIQEYEWANFSSDTWSVGVSGTWMIFEGFQRENALRAARAARREAEENLRALSLSAISETWDAYFRAQAAIRHYEFGEALLASSQEAFDAIEASYIQGLATITELVQAEKDLQEARSTLVSTRADLLTSASDLAFAAGYEYGRYHESAESQRVAAEQ